MTWMRPSSEYEALLYVVRRLTARYPGADEQELFDWAGDALERLGSARLRQYVPQLVEHELRARIIAESTSARIVA